MNEIMLFVVGLVNLEINFTFNIVDDYFGEDRVIVTFKRAEETFTITNKNNLLKLSTSYGEIENLTAVDILSYLQGGAK